MKTATHNKSQTTKKRSGMFKKRKHSTEASTSALINRVVFTDRMPETAPPQSAEQQQWAYVVQIGRDASQLDWEWSSKAKGHVRLRPLD
jgi:hypothetical protein